MAKTKTFSLYLAKEDIKNFADVFTKKAEDKIAAGAKVFESNDLGEKATVFIFENNPMPPNWLSVLGSVFHELPSIKNKSSCAIIVFFTCR